MTNTPARLSEDEIQAMIDGLAGVTPGPWADGVHHRQRYGGREYAHITSNRDIVPIATVPLGVDGYGFEEGAARARHIARCDPDTMRSILTELLALRRSTDGCSETPTADREYDDIDDPRKTGLASLMSEPSPTIPVNERMVTDEMVQTFGAAFWGEHWCDTAEDRQQIRAGLDAALNLPVSHKGAVE